MKLTNPAPGVFRIEPGREVICDWCGKDYTDSPAQGGIYGFLTKAICPDCAGPVELAAVRDNETQYIRARCPAGKSFADWVREDLR